MTGRWDDVAVAYGTDKASTHHGYMDTYQTLIEGRAVGRLLEIGVAHGKSLAMWHDLLPDALIVGVDIDDACRLHQRQRIAVLIADAANPAHMAAVSALHGPFDVIVDDGEHDERTVRTAFDELWWRLASPGVYIVEDLDMAQGWVRRWVEQTQMDMRWLLTPDRVGQIADPGLLVAEKW